MDRFSPRGGSGVVLFDEDFDQPPPPLEPEVIEPVYSAAELTAARETAASDARDRALAEAEASARAGTRLALTEIATHLATTQTEATALAEQTAEAIARLLLDCFATAFPALGARHGATEATAVMRAILPALHREPKITVRVNPHLIATMTEELATLDSDLAARVRLLPTDALALGDARISWDNGTATRDIASLWRQIETVLTETGLLDPAVKPLPTAKEHELVE